MNVVPGLGAGYLYQRRWKAYWITSAWRRLGLSWVECWDRGLRLLKKSKTNGLACLGLLLSRLEQQLKPASQ